MMHKSERRRIEQAFPFIQLYLVIKGGAISNSESKLPEIEKHIDDILNESNPKRRQKLDNRIARLNMDCGITDLVEAETNGHKFILIIYFLILEIAYKTNTVFKEDLEGVFQYFLDAESNSPKSDKEVEKLRKSGEKQGKKLFIKLQELGYFND